MRKTIWIVSQVTALFAFGIHAQELPSVTAARAKSFAGTSFEEASKEVRAVRGVRTSTHVVDIGKRFVASGLLKIKLKNRSFEWTTEQHPSLPRIHLHRLLSAKEPAVTPDEAMDELRKSQGVVDDRAVSARAEDVARALHEAGAFAQEETFVLVHEGQQPVIFVEPSGRQQGFIYKYRRVYRRHVAGVPVMGRAGEFEISFDADGEVEAIEVPTDSYQVTGKTLPKLAAKSGLAQVSKRAGFDSGLSNVDQQLRRGGIEASVDDLQCGYVDDESNTKLARGCLVKYHSRGLHHDLVRAE
jgi:hypothetical protein